jgi:HK97 family phage portal protein
MAKPLVVRLANTFGTALGEFQKSRQIARFGRKPVFFSSMAEEARWRQSGSTQALAHRRAIQNSWVFTAISMIAREVSAAEFQVVEYKGEENEPVQIPNHPIEKVLRYPNESISQTFLWQYSAWWLQLSGNAYWYLLIDPLGKLIEVWPLPAESVDPFPGEDGEEFVKHYLYTVGGTEYQIPPRNIVHMRLTNPYDIYRGMSPLTAAIMPSDTDTAMSRWNSTFFGKDNVMPSAIVNLSSGDSGIPVNQADADALKDDLKADYQAFKRKTAVTSVARLEVELLGWNPKDLDFISGRQFTKEEIYEIFGIPGGLFDKNATYSNSSNADRVFRDKTIWPLLLLMAEQITTELIVPMCGQEFEAAFADMRLSNRELELQEIQAAGPYLTVDEVREKHYKMEPLPEKRGELTTVEAQSAGTSAGFSEPGGYEEGGDVIDGEAEEIAPDDKNGREDGKEKKPRERSPMQRPEQEKKPNSRAMMEQLSKQDMKRWRLKSINAIRRRKPLPIGFKSDVITSSKRGKIVSDLLRTDGAREFLSIDEQIEEIKIIFGSAVKAPKGRRAHPWERWEGRLRTTVTNLMRRESSRLSKLVKEQGTGALENEEFWGLFRENMFNTVSEMLAGVSLLGIAHGRERLAAGPREQVNWNLANQQARDWARGYTADLITNITQTTRDRLRAEVLLWRDEVAEWVEERETLPNLIRRISTVVGDPKRAETIATTEATRVYAEGNAQAWEAAGVTRAAYKPPAHPNCRCYLQPKKIGNVWVMIWYTARDDRVCTTLTDTPWGVVEGCRGLHGLCVSAGEFLGKKV